MPSVGQILRGARLQVGLTLEQISARTCISQKNLKAIEEDDLGQITSAFFYKSFVRQLSQHVGLKYEDLAEAVQEAATFYPEPFKPEQLQTLAQRAVVTPRKRAFNLRTPIAVASFTVVLAGCSAVYAFWERGWKEIPESASQVLTSVQSLIPGTAETKEVRAEPKPQASTATPHEQQHVTPQDNGFRVEVSAIEPSWLSIVADGRETFSGILEPKERKVVEGRNTGRMRAGNAGGVKVVFNGRPVGVMGPRGQVRTVVFTKNNYEVLGSAPTHVASLELLNTQLDLRTDAASSSAFPLMAALVRAAR